MLPSACAVTHLGPVGAIEISGNAPDCVANKGMEGLTIPPDSKMLVGTMQAPLMQEGGKTVRIVTMDIATGTTHQYAYTLTTGSGVSEIVAVNEHTFLVDKHDGKGLGDGATAVVQHLYYIDLAGAQEASDVSRARKLAGQAGSKTLAEPGVFPSLPCWWRGRG